MEVQRKKGARSIFNRTGILAVGLMVLVVAVAGCTSEQGSGNKNGGKTLPSVVPNATIKGEPSFNEDVKLNVYLKSYLEHKVELTVKVPASFEIVDEGDFRMRNESLYWEGNLSLKEEKKLSAVIKPVETGYFKLEASVKPGSTDELFIDVQENKAEVLETPRQRDNKKSTRNAQ